MHPFLMQHNQGVGNISLLTYSFHLKIIELNFSIPTVGSL